MEQGLDIARQLVNSQEYAVHRYVVGAVAGLYVGRLVLGKLFALGNAFRAYFLAPLGILRTNVKKYGKWAVVTGASEGIGRGYALELARRGLDVVIMSRSREKLDKVAQEITSKYKEREVRVLPVDFSKGEEVYPDIAEELKDLDIGILVNNVGYIYKYPEELAKAPAKWDHTLIELNIQAMLQMCRIVLPGMESKNKGIIINVSSTVRFHPAPMYTVYYASKVFTIAFTDSLRKDYERKGIELQTVSPAVVATGMSGMDEGLFSPHPNAFARGAINTIGIQKDTIGYWTHALQTYVLGLLPNFLLDMALRSFVVNHKEAILKKMAKEQ